MNWRFWDRSGQADCKGIEPLLSLYSDDMASPAERRRVESHLPACPDCRQALEWMQATRQVISRRPSLTPPADLRARIARAIAEADAAKAPVVTAPLRPARRPLILRSALAYGLTLALFAGVAGDVLWNAGHPTHPQVATVPHVRPHPAPLVANTVPDPHTSAVIDSVLGHVNQTLHSALTAAPPANVRRIAVRTAHTRTTSPAILRVVPTQEQELPRLAVVPHTHSAPTLTPISPKPQVAVTHMAAKPPAEHPTPAPRPITPTPNSVDNRQVASANVPHEEAHTPTVTAPAPVAAPVAHEPSLVAERPHPVLEGVSHFVADMHTAALTSRATVVNYTSHIATADFSTDRSGTLPITSAPVH